MQSTEFDTLNERMLTELLDLNPDCATIFGKHDPYDRLLPHGGFEKIRDTLALLEGWERSARRIAGREQLSRDQLVSLDVLTTTLAMYRFAARDYPLWRMRPDALENPGAAMLMMLMRDYAPLEDRLESMSARIAELPRYLEQYRKRFAGAKTPRVWTESALDSCRSFPGFLESALSLARTGASPGLAARFEKSVSLAREELDVHEDWLASMLDSAADEFAMGRERFVGLLRARGIALSPEQLLALASQKLADLRRERAELARRLAQDGTVEGARRAIETKCPGSDTEVLERTNEAVARAKEFVISHDLATVPEGCEVVVMSTPGFLRDATPSAATYLPAVFEESQRSIYLVTCTGDPQQLRATWNYASIDHTAVHEAYPGHHLQGVLSNRKPWMHQLPHIVYSPDTPSPPYESQEGWATYCEDMMREKGFLGSDEHAFSILDYSIWTACRVFSEVMLSCGMARIDEVVDIFVRETGCPRALAEADVKGFSRMPGYGICYLLGRHQVTTLKMEIASAMGGEFSEKRFHDLVAAYGNLPFHILEREVRHGMGAKKG